MRGRILSLCEELYVNHDISVDEVTNLALELFGYLRINLNDQAVSAIRDRPDFVLPIKNNRARDHNSYRYSDDITIEINTIYGVKGQTHEAILVLETCFHKHDLSEIFPYLVGDCIEDPCDRIKFHYLPLTYVACTRPTHLLCLAIRKDHLTENQQGQLKKFGWNVHNLT